MSNIVSFCILNNCCPAYGPVHESFEGDITKDNVMKIVRKLLFIFLEKDNDPSKCYCDRINKSEIENITNNLVNEKYYVINNFEKYYVIAFALNFTSFEIFSKNVNKQIIKWRDDDKNDKIVNIIANDNYKLDPMLELVLKFREINGFNEKAMKYYFRN